MRKQCTRREEKGREEGREEVDGEGSMREEDWDDEKKKKRGKERGGRGG